MAGLTSPEVIQQKPMSVALGPQIKDGKTLYNGQEVNVQASRDIGRVFAGFLDGDQIRSHLEAKYNAKAVPAGSLAVDCAVRYGRINDFDARIVDLKTNTDVPLEVLKDLSKDERFYELCLEFLDTSDSPEGALGSALAAHGVSLESKNIDFIAPVVPDQPVKGFQTATWTYHKQFNKRWKTDTYNENDEFVKMRRAIRERIEKERGLSK
jgi:hypothetical protein